MPMLTLSTVATLVNLCFSRFEFLDAHVAVHPPLRPTRRPVLSSLHPTSFDRRTLLHNHILKDIRVVSVFTPTCLLRLLTIIFHHASTTVAYQRRFRRPRRTHDERNQERHSASLVSILILALTPPPSSRARARATGQATRAGLRLAAAPPPAPAPSTPPSSTPPPPPLHSSKPAQPAVTSLNSVAASGSCDSHRAPARHVRRDRTAPPIVVVSAGMDDVNAPLEAMPSRTAIANRLRQQTHKDTIRLIGKPPRKQCSSVTERVEVEKLPAFVEVGPNERPELFVRKLRQCSTLFDFNDASAELKGRQIKAATLHEMLGYITTQRSVISELIYPEVISSSPTTSSVPSRPRSTPLVTHLIPKRTNPCSSSLGLTSRSFTSSSYASSRPQLQHQRRQTLN
ncbi:hypothetical protein FS749_014119 [Ceratobasidium sp. UAMH 11750]|nr:hypothetical protein FS749_014119 [Ceratobasidium sp. UAMH 11750]